MASKPRGILKKGPSTSSRTRAQWDERNLDENERIKEELNPTRIDEPKTPFHAPLEASVDIPALDLDDDTAVQVTREHTRSTEEAETRRESTDDDDDDPQYQGDFSKRRKRHYQMGNVLSLGKQLLDEEKGGSGSTATLAARAKAASMAAAQNDAAERLHEHSSGNV